MDTQARGAPWTPTPTGHHGFCRVDLPSSALLLPSGGSSVLALARGLWHNPPPVMNSSQAIDSASGGQLGLWTLLRSTLIANLLCGAGLGLWEAVTITRDNLLFPMGAAHLILLFVASAFYAGIAAFSSLLAWLAARWLGLPRGLVIAAGPWVLLVVCSVSAYRSAALSSARSIAGTAITLGILGLAILLLGLVARRDSARPGSAHLFSMAVAVSALGLGFFSLASLAIGLETDSAPDIEAEISQSEPKPHDTGVRVLLIGLDGVPWKVVDPLVRAERLPVLGNLMARGVTADLETILPTFSPIIWTSIATGKAAEKHGVFDHTRTRMPFGLPSSAVAIQRLETATKASRLAVRWASRMMELASVSYLSGDIRSLELWDICDSEGLPAITLSWYISYPAYSENGIQVSDHLARGKGASRSDPGLATPSVLPELLPGVVDPDTEDLELLFSLLDTTGIDEKSRGQFHDDHEDWFRTAWRPMARDLSTLGFARQVFPVLRDWRLASVFYKSVDGIHHLSWKHIDLPGTEMDRHPERRFRTSVENLYLFSDDLVGETLDLLDDGSDLQTVVIIVSDHGWDDSTRAHDMAPDGIFLMAGGPTLPSSERTRLHIYDVAPTILALLGLPVPLDMDGRVATELVSPAFWEEFPIQHIATYESEALPQHQEMEIELDENDLNELKALGYIE